jgi:hypothetical protein
MTLDVGKAVFGICKQSAKGTAASNPAFAFGLAGGGIGVDIAQEPDKLTSAYLSPAGAYRSKADTGASIETRAWQKAIGLLLYGALGAISTTGAGPYTHVITLGSALPYLTVFDKKGDGTILGVKDCKIDELELSWEENMPLDVSVKFAGGALSFPTFTAVVDESDTVAYYTPVGGTFKYDVDSGTAVEASILGGKIVIGREAKPYTFSGDIEAADVMEGACSVEVSLSVLPADMTLWRTIATGTSSGTGISNSPVYGSIEHTFVVGADSLKFAATNVGFLVDIPEADPDGGAAESELAGVAYRVTGTPITATLINTQVSY